MDCYRSLFGRNAMPWWTRLEIQCLDELTCLPKFDGAVDQKNAAEIHWTRRAINSMSRCWLLACDEVQWHDPKLLEIRWLDDPDEIPWTWQLILRLDPRIWIDEIHRNRPLLKAMEDSVNSKQDSTLTIETSRISRISPERWLEEFDNCWRNQWTRCNSFDLTINSIPRWTRWILDLKATLNFWAWSWNSMLRWPWNGNSNEIQFVGETLDWYLMAWWKMLN